MTSNIKKCIIFPAVFFAFISLVQYGFDQLYNKKSKQKFNLLLEHHIDSSVMVFGSSVAFVHIDPKIIKQETGLSCYNMGYHGLFLPQSMPLINEYLSFEKNCKCIVICCDYESLKRNSLITRPDMFWSHLSNKYIFNSLSKIEPTRVYKARYIPGYKITLMNKAFFKSIFTPERKSDDYNGFEPVHSGWTASKLEHETINVACEDDVYLELKQTVAAIKAKGIKLVLVLPPLYYEGIDIIKNRELIEQKYTQLADGKNVIFINYTTNSICMNKSYFYNFSHLNDVGAHIFTNIVAKDVKNFISKVD